MSVEEIITNLKEIADADIIELKRKRYGIISSNALGIYHKDLKELAKSIPKSDELASQLFESGIYEARLLCSKIFNPRSLSLDLMDYWTSTFDNWEICDSFCMGLYAKSPLATQKIKQWATRQAEFERRASFATMAAYCMADKKAPNEVFENFLPIIITASVDDRNFVKKAVNWALRSIGKRNIDLNKKAIRTAQELLDINSKSAKWIAKDALRELTNPDVRISDYPRSIYRA